MNGPAPVPRHFISLGDFTADELNALIDRAIELKAMRAEGARYEPLRGRTLAMIFEMASTRTRVAFEAGMAQLGGHALFLSSQNSQLGRGEPVEDTARVLSEMVDGVMIRAASHEQLERFAQYSSVPVINAMTSRNHPCQILADVQAFTELRGSIRGRQVAFVGDGYNMCHSYIEAAHHFDFRLAIACPEGYAPDPALLAAHADRVTRAPDARAAVAGADLVVTDVWSSMGHESELAARRAAFASYQVTTELMALAAPDALFMHCLPAHRGEEISDEMLDHPGSAVWREAGNRLHTQKALLEKLLAPNRGGDRD